MNRATSIRDRGTIDLSAVSLQAFAARNVQLLTAIEQTLNHLDSDARHISLMVADIRKVMELLGATKAMNLDPEGRVVDLLRMAAEGALRMYNRAIAKCDSARADVRLTPEDGVVAAFEGYIAVVADYHNTIVDFLEQIETLKAMAEPRNGPAYTDMGAMFKDLLA